MRSLTSVHNLNVTFISAIPSSSPEIIWIQERLYDDFHHIPWTFNSTPSETWRSHFLLHSSSPSLLLPPPSHTLAEDKKLTNFPEETPGVTSLGGAIACYVTHLRLVRRMVEEGWGETIVFEDDVDLEWEFRKRWDEVVNRSWPREGWEWDLLYLGYSFSHETRYEPVHSRESSSPHHFPDLRSI